MVRLAGKLLKRENFVKGGPRGLHAECYIVARTPVAAKCNFSEDSWGSSEVHQPFLGFL